jgi:hypothetical protein
MNTSRKLISLAFIAATAAASNVFADELLGTTSTGSSDISLTINDSVKISGVDDLTFPAYGADDTGSINIGDAFCVYRNGADGYNITATNPNGSEFSLYNDTTQDTVQYTLALDESASAAAASQVGYDTAVSFTSGSVKTDCSDETNSVNTSFDIRIAEQEIRDTTSGVYTGTLQLLLAAE